MDSKKTTVLYIDDDPEDQEIFCEGIQSLDPSIDCLRATNGTMALDIAKRDIPDYIFIDLNMPHLSARETLRAIRKDVHLRDVTVVIYSTAMSPSDIDELKSMGANYCIKKASTFKDLINTLQSVFQKKV